MICYAIIDTNVLVSALLSRNSDAATVQVVARTIEGKIIPVYSKEIMKEYYEVLHRKKFKLDPTLVDTLLAAIEKYGTLVVPYGTGTVLPDAKNLPFYEVLTEKCKNNAYLVTGNLKHFLTEPFIVTARQLLEILDGNS